MRLILLIFALILPFLFASCNKYKPAEPAFFVKASEVKIAVTPKQGTASHKVTDLWLYVNNQFQGAYPVGNRMPIITKNQSTKIHVFAGIKNNGISDTRIFYPLYERLEFDTLLPSGTDILRPFTFSYKSSAVFSLIESFEGGINGFNIQKSVDSDTTFYLTDPTESFEGTSIQMGLSGRSQVGKMETTIAYELPKSSPDVYLELNYKGNQDFAVGLIGDNGLEKSALIITSKSDWNKIYISLAAAINTEPISKSYKLYFKFLNNTVHQPKIYLDNIKIVHY